MHPNAILHEIQQLYRVSDRLDSLAGQHPVVSEALITISGSVRNTQLDQQYQFAIFFELALGFGGKLVERQNQREGRPSHEQS